MKVVVCLLMCGLVENAMAEFYGTDVSDKLFDALIARIDQLEEKLEGREKVHQTEMARQMDRINQLEATVRQQQDQINAMQLLVPQGNVTTSQEKEVDSQENSTPARNERAVKLGNRIRDAENGDGVAFFATLSTNTEHLGTNQIIAFDHVVTNIGNGYNPHVGSFMAPNSGTYAFSVTLMTQSRHMAHYVMYRNSDPISYMYVNGLENQYDSTSQTAVLHLAKGDDITIRHRDSNHTLHGYGYSIFSGFLLSVHISPIFVGK